MDAEGTAVTPLGLPEVRHPQWSPDWTKIAFQSGDIRAGDISVMNPDGSGIVNLSNTPDRGEAYPTWSPDGTGIAFVAHAPLPVHYTELDSGLWLMRADGTNVTRISGDCDEPRSLPSWSPDGTKLVYACPWAVSAEGTGATLDFMTVVNADGTGITHYDLGGLDLRYGSVPRNFQWSPAR